MTETYSIATKAALVDDFKQPLLVTLPDSAASVNLQQQAMMDGLPVLCKQIDGTFAWYTFDAERSTPALPLMLKVT